MRRRRKKIMKDEKGVASLFDAVMFFTVMLIAATVISVFSNQTAQTADVAGNEEMIRYTEETRTAILQSTILDTWYINNGGNVIPCLNMTINELIMEELAQLDNGLPSDNFQEGIESDIEDTLDDLVKSGFDYALQAKYKSHEIFISSKSILSEEDIPEGLVVSSYWSSPMIYERDGDADITLNIWRN